MFEQIKSELSSGKKIYIFEMISSIGFVLFLLLGDKLPIFTTTLLGNYIMLGWIFINVLVLVSYVIYEFGKILMKEKIIQGNIIRHFLIKILFFITLFMINIFPITMFMMLAGSRTGIDMSLPILALMVALLIVSIARRSIPSAKALTILGVLWFATIFMGLYLISPLLYVGIVYLVKQEMIASTILSILFFSGALFIFYQVIRQIKVILTDK